MRRDGALLGTVWKYAARCVLATGIWIAAGTASADSGTPKKAQRYELVANGTSIKAGGARIPVNAKIDTVRSAIKDFNNYSKYIPKFERTRVVAKGKQHTDVYLRVPIMKGAANVWAVVRFEAPKKIGEVEVIKAKMIQGNVDRLEATWRIKPIDEGHTELSLEMLIVPTLPVPSSIVTGEAAYAADKAVSGIRTRAEALATTPAG
jgi:ribosome-associated toxin RatA of RatAB toxin-antitoxin module